MVAKPISRLQPIGISLVEAGLQLLQKRSLITILSRYFTLVLIQEIGALITSMEMQVQVQVKNPKLIEAEHRIHPLRGRLEMDLEG